MIKKAKEEEEEEDTDVEGGILGLETSRGHHSPHSCTPSHNSNMPRTPSPLGPRPPPSPPMIEDSTSQDGVGLRGQDPLNTMIGLFPTHQQGTNVVTYPGYPSVEGNNGPAPPSFPPAPLPVADVNDRGGAKLSNGMIKPVVLQSLPGGGVHPSLKERQQGLIDMFYASADLQCKTCGQQYSR